MENLKTITVLTVDSDIEISIFTVAATNRVGCPALIGACIFKLQISYLEFLSKALQISTIRKRLVVTPLPMDIWCGALKTIKIYNTF